MNKIDFLQPGGFPLDQDVFDFQQANTFMLQQLASLCGPRTILNGCIETGGNVSAGYVSIDGEILPLQAGAKQAKLVIRQIATNMLYEDGASRPSQIERYIEFGDDGVTTLLWADFKRNASEGVLSRLERLEWLVKPFMTGNGSMVLWRKPATDPLPVGWQEVVNWRGRIAMGHAPGVTGYEIGDGFDITGYKLNINHIPEHDHDYLKGKGTGSASGNLDPHPDGGFDTVKTGKAGKADPDTLPLPPVRFIMYIEPIPNFYPAI